MNQFVIKQIASYDELKSTLEANSIDYDYELINKSFLYTSEKHSGQFRDSGEDYIHHCFNVAFYCAQLKLDTVTICSALLHDVVERTDTTIDEVDEEFGTEIAFIVEGLSKIRTYSKNFDRDEKQEEFTNLIFNASEDIRIIVIRLCEKLHNLITIDKIDEKIRLKAARKALYIYAPLAEYLGLSAIQGYLEDRSFEVLKPEEFKLIDSWVQQYFEKTANIIDEFETEIKELLREYSINNYKFRTRKKGIYSSYKKLKNRYNYRALNLSLEEALPLLKDIYAGRIIVESVEQCYIVLGLIQANFQTLQEEFSDYIAHPKENGYKSIHTLFKYDETVFEVQIRTFEMHEFCEFGPASHIAYKLQSTGQKANSETLTWTKDLLTWKEKHTLSKEDFQIKAFRDSVFCFTPKGEVITLPKDASPIDFAFRVHTEVGSRYQGALVNKKMVSMDSKLKTGDIVEILTAKQKNVSRDWIRFAKSNSTRARIRKELR